MKQEFEMNFGVLDARMKFTVENVDGETETYVDIHSGYELFERMKQYATEDFKTLFENESLPVFFATLQNIEFKHEQEDVKFRMSITDDDVPYCNLRFSPKTLQDENAKKISLIREIVDYDRESENGLLHQLLKK